MNAYETIINNLATEVADKAHVLIKERIERDYSGSAGLLSLLLVTTPVFKVAVEKEFETLLDSAAFSDEVKGIAEQAAEDAADSAINRHEREYNHNDNDEILDSREFELAVETVVDEKFSEFQRDEPVQMLTDRVDNLEDNEMLFERIASLLSDASFRSEFLRALANGTFDVEAYRAAKKAAANKLAAELADRGWAEGARGNDAMRGNDIVGSEEFVEPQDKEGI